ALSAVKPDLVYCSISGFGQTGPLRQQPAFAHIINAISGMMHLEQGADPAPRVAYIQAADVLAGTHAFGAIMAALWRREHTGQGSPTTLDSRRQRGVARTGSSCKRSSAPGSRRSSTASTRR